MFIGLPSASVVLASLLALYSAPAQAAQCDKYDYAMKSYLASSESILWQLRQKACGDGACGSSQQCTLSARRGRDTASLYRKDVQYAYKDCWSAIDNIITQCNRNWYKTGWWQYGDQFYQMYATPYEDLRRDGEIGSEEEETIFEVVAWNNTET